MGVLAVGESVATPCPSFTTATKATLLTTITAHFAAAMLVTPYEPRPEGLSTGPTSVLSPTDGASAGGHHLTSLWIWKSLWTPLGVEWKPGVCHPQAQMPPVRVPLPTTRNAWVLETLFQDWFVMVAFLIGQRIWPFVAAGELHPSIRTKSFVERLLSADIVALRGGHA